MRGITTLDWMRRSPTRVAIPLDQFREWAIVFGKAWELLYDSDTPDNAFLAVLGETIDQLEALIAETEMRHNRGV